MGQLVVNVREDGTVETLLKDSVFDTRMFGGERKIKRITLIEFSEPEQKFFIKWLAGPFAAPYGRDVLHRYCEARYCLGQGRYTSDTEDESLMWFDTYDEAVAHEIECVNALRLKGVKFDV